jgi:neutral ceramidase
MFAKTKTAKTPKKQSKLRLWVKRVIKIAIVLLLLPWPADNSTYVDSDYQAATLARLKTKPAVSLLATTIRLGIAEVDISPPPEHPLAGHWQRIPKAYTNIHSRCYGRAVTLAWNQQQVTILTADILTIHPQVARVVLAKAGLQPDDVYFTSTHTHAGPGGYVDRGIEELSLGRYQGEYFNDLTTKLADTIKRSRQQLVEVEMASLTIDVSDKLKNRIDKTLPTYSTLSALVFRRITDNSAAARPLAILISFSAHPTILTQNQRRLSSGYPGALVDEIKRRTGANMVLFAAGAVGSSRPTFGGEKRPDERYARAVAYGKLLADRLMKHWDEKEYERRFVMSNTRLKVDLPPMRLTVASRLRLNPLYTSHLLDRQSHVHVLRIGQTVLTGFPADYGSDLALALDEWFTGRQLNLIPTSFNGDYRGYMVSQNLYFEYGNYETRVMSFFGPWVGDYLNDTVKRIIEHTTPLKQAPKINDGS